MSLKSSELLPEACRSLFLGDLSCFCQEVDLFRVFSQFGEIEEIRIKRNEAGNGLGYGFVTFLEMKAAEKAIGADGLVILGRPVKISWANVRTAGDTKVSLNPFPVGKARKGAITADSVETAQLHFSFISKQHVQLVTEATVRKVFANFGDVVDVTIKKTNTNPQTGEQTGYGFVHFPLTDAGIHSAICGAKVIRQVHINHVLYDCRLTWSLEEIIYRRQMEQQVQPPRTGSSINTMNYMETTPVSVSPRAGSHGMSSLNVYRNHNSNPAGFACFSQDSPSSYPPVHMSTQKPVLAKQHQHPRRTFSSSSMSMLSDLPLSSLSSSSSMLTDQMSHPALVLEQPRRAKNSTDFMSFDELDEKNMLSLGLETSSQSSLSSLQTYQLPSNPRNPQGNYPFQLY